MIKSKIADSWLLYAEVIRSGSLNAAARSRGMAPSSVMRRLKALEETAGVRLLSAGKRGVMPTPEGLKFAERALKAAEKLLGTRPEMPVSETLSVWTDPRISFSETASSFAGLAHAGAGFEFQTGGREDADIRLELRPFGKSVPPERVGVMLRTLAANPGYLASSGVPLSASDLSRHVFIRVRGDAVFSDALPEPRRSVFVNSLDQGISLAAAGAGILIGVPAVIVQRLSREGKLSALPVLPDDVKSAELFFSVRASFFALRLKAALSDLFS